MAQENYESTADSPDDGGRDTGTDALAPFKEAYDAYINALTDAYSDAQDEHTELTRASQREWTDAARVGDLPRAEQSLTTYATGFRELRKSWGDRCRTAFEEYVRAQAAAWGSAQRLTPADVAKAATAESLAASYVASITGSWT